jgi:alpha-amylase/alpha-mannosidase (GH57 family)
METPPLSVVIHGHFYQPPRDDPWLETVEAQPSAAPYHDWNARVTDDCYRAVVAARVPGPDGRISDIVNTLEHISFNFGPTLLEWMEGEAPQTYKAILEADAVSTVSKGGHGNAIAQAYHHTILPLASRREKVSEVRWGIRDFRRRFGRDPVGMWLPETAVDSITLDVLAQEGIAFTIVAPHQVEHPPPNGLPGLFRTPGGRSIALFVYNGPISHGVAFGFLLKDSKKWAGDLLGEARNQHAEGLVSIATDGETYGHHHRFGEMALAAVLRRLQREPTARVENFSSFLSRNPAHHEVTLVEPSSWSCSHGVERWRSDCGCKMDPAEDTQQKWRGVLREAINWLADQIHQVYETEGPALLGDPWSARDRYGAEGSAETTHPRALELLEMERHALRLFTSCGWFFDDLAGLEPIQVLRYAARALELTGSRRQELEEGFLERLGPAVSNEDPPRDGRQIYLEEVKPLVSAPLRVAAGAALWEAIPPPELTPSSVGPQAEPPLSGSAFVDADTDQEAERNHGAVRKDEKPAVPGYRVAKEASGLFRVTHRRTGRHWDVETKIYRPSAGQGAVAVRDTGAESEFIPLDLKDIPEGFRIPVTRALRTRIPDFSRDLVRAIEDLRMGWGKEPDGAGGRLSRVRDLADLHILLGVGIPFEAQTTFIRMLKEAEPKVARRLQVLRGPLGFTPAP